MAMSAGGLWWMMKKVGRKEGCAFLFSFLVFVFWHYKKNVF
jgi:hypothetical protein